VIAGLPLAAWVVWRQARTRPLPAKHEASALSPRRHFRVLGRAVAVLQLKPKEKRQR